MELEQLLTYLARVIVLLFILPFHELAHAWMARKMGDDTALYSGRLTLNPFAHIDPMGSILMLLTGYGWAKPVPINPLRMKKYRAGIALTALAGPVANLIAAFLCSLAINVAWCFEPVRLQYWNGIIGEINPVYCLILILGFAQSVNVGLAIFNLLPIPPLDGSKILSYFTPPKYDKWLERNAQQIRIIFWIAIIGLGNLPSAYNPLAIAGGFVNNLIYKATVWIPNLVLS